LEKAQQKAYDYLQLVRECMEERKKENMPEPEEMPSLRVGI
jgi:hypothetical protein